MRFFRETIISSIHWFSCNLFNVFYSFDNDSFSLQIMEAFKVAPFDQNLCYHGQYLTDSSQTLGNYLEKRNIKSCFECDYHLYLIVNVILGELRVLPKSLIYLRADEPNPGASAIEPDDGWAMQHPEEGFKGKYLI